MTCIAICGDSSSGKTMLANLLASKLGNTTILECDRYHKWERNDPRWKHYTQLNPTCNDLSLLKQDVIDLKNGKSIFRHNYDHSTGSFTKEYEIRPLDHLIVVGLHTLMNPELYDLTIFMDPDFTLKTKWKIERDISKRGYTVEQVKDQIERRKPDYEQFIKSLKHKADIVVNFNDNFALTIYVQNQFSLAYKICDYIYNYGK